MKTAVITGASGVIGSALVKTFIDKGFFVIGQYNKGLEKITALREDLDRLGKADNFFAVQADFSVSGEALRFASVVKQNFKTVNVLVANAGVDVYKLLTDTTEEEWDRVFDVNVKSAYILSREFLPKMQERESGRIIFISSVWGVKGGCMEACYSASKFALNGLCKALAQEVAGNNVTVNCVCPGVVQSPMNAQLSSEEMQDVILSTPVKRTCNAQEIADLVEYLASDKAGFITGEEILIDGGFTL